MKKILLFILTLQIHFLCAQTIHQSEHSAADKRNTYAVVVGISDYQNEGITKLDFAHKDAEVFADYLKSKSGGSVPEENIRLLKNEEATYTAIYEALQWLVETCHEKDLVYFYFSGHGDMENNTIYKLGFLLSYNTPRTNYINNAVRIEDLNYYANTLSVQTKAKVILITDACHSGKLTGSDFRGTFLVGDQLRNVLNNEIRITSCAPDQLSAEDAAWGGGRGVFSYYLINGLEGLADKQKDGEVDLKEIQTYLTASLSNDPLLKERNHIQTPVIKGNEKFEIATVDKNTLAKLNLGNTAEDNVVKIELPKPAQYYFFNALGNEKPENVFDFNVLDKLSKEEIPYAMIEMLLKKPNITDTDKLHALENVLRSNNDARKRFTDKLVDVMSSRGQEIINLYLNGDEAEMERRRYYNSVKNEYDVYPKMFSVARKLLDEKNPLSKILEIKQHYFAGVTARLKIPLS